MPPRVSVILVNWNTSDLLRESLTCVYRSAAVDSFEAWVVDNGSTDDSVNVAREAFPEVHVVANADNAGFARANNQAFRASAGDYVLLLNTDAFLAPEALAALCEVLDRQPRAGAVGACLFNADGSFQASHTAFPTLGREFLILSTLGRRLYGAHYPSRGPELERGPQVVEYVEGACLLIRREAYAAVGGLDEGYFMYAEEVDLCYALRRAGWEVWYQPAARVTHLGGASSRQRRPEREGDLYRSRVRFFRKYYGVAAAAGLILQIFVFTLLKSLGHAVARWGSRGQHGRPVVSLSYLAQLFRDLK